MKNQHNCVDSLLNDRSYHIEFNGHLTNHAKHAVVALWRLGAPDSLIHSFYESYAKETSYGFGLEPARHSVRKISDENWLQFLGKRTSYSSYCDYFESKEREMGTSKLLQKYVPILIEGWIGALTHATIHLGWALDAGNRWMTIEGLAYMSYTFVSCHPERLVIGNDLSRSAIDSLQAISANWEENYRSLNKEIEESMNDSSGALASGMHPELVRSGLQYRIARMACEGISSRPDLLYTTPYWIETEEVEECWSQLHYAVTVLYASAPGDFLILHLITSLHAMEQIASHMPEECQKFSVKCFWLGMLKILFSKAEFPKLALLQKLSSKYREYFDDPNDPKVKEGWKHIVSRAIKEKEEHNPKMAYVLQNTWHRFGYRAIFREAASCFTVTPQLPESFREPPNDQEIAENA